MTLLTQRETASVLRLGERTQERLRCSGMGPNSSGVVVAQSVTDNPTSMNGSLGTPIASRGLRVLGTFCFKSIF